MFIENIYLLYFRNFERIELNFSGKYNFIIGDNAQGKTNILEGLYFSAKGKSFKQNKDRELIHFDHENAYLRTLANTEGIREKIEVKLSKEKKKIIRINEEPIDTLKELRTFFDIIVFTPDEFSIIKNGKSYRRDFLDEVISMISGYRNTLRNYKRLLEHRNQLMKRSKNSRYFKQQLQAVTVELVKAGSIILHLRGEYVKRLEYYAKKFHGILSDEKEILTVDYDSSVEFQGTVMEIQKDFYHKLSRNLERDLYSGFTSVGPHRDDLLIDINGHNTKAYASQGQQRTAVLSLKLAQLKLFEQTKETSPVILLDDVFSELDEKRIRFLLGILSPYQSMITAVNTDFLKDIKIKEGKIFYIEKGKLKEELCI